MNSAEVEQALEHLQKAVSMDPKNLDYLLYACPGVHRRQVFLTTRADCLIEILAVYPDNEIALELMKKDRSARLAFGLRPRFGLSEDLSRP